MIPAAAAALSARPRTEGLTRAVSLTVYWQGQGVAFDPEALVTTEDGNRWNRPGEPTVYLAGDPGLALVEAGRHMSGIDDSDAQGIVWSLHLEAPHILDLRSHGVRETLGLDDPYWFLGRRACRELAASLRDGWVCAGILTQSAGLPDVADRWNLVLFTDRLDRPLRELVSRPKSIGRFRLRLDGDD